MSLGKLIERFGGRIGLLSPPLDRLGSNPIGEAYMIVLHECKH